MTQGSKRKFYTFDELSEFANKLGVKPNTVLWYSDPENEENNISQETNVYRSGNKPEYDEKQQNTITKNKPLLLLSWRDINKLPRDNKEKYIPQELWETEFVNPGQGLSLFLKPVIDKGASLYSHLEPDGDPCKITGAADKAAKKQGYSPRVTRHFYELHISGTIPAGLQVVYDGGIDEDTPPGHCTLTVVSKMKVVTFHRLVEQFVSPKMVYIGPALFGWKKHA